MGKIHSMEQIYLAGGCFWGMEELFRKFDGVIDTETGYSGGENDNPSYRSHPGHAETLQITFDPTKTSYNELLDFFFRIHDPTTIDSQGNDIGSSYRSAIFFQSEDEKIAAQTFINKVDTNGSWGKPVVTKLEPFKKFWPAEPEHQDYLQTNPAGYTCHFVRPMQSFL